MKSELKAKLLQHFIKKNNNGGFTLIELLVVIIIIGILSAIALPSFLNQASKAKQSEAKTYTGSMNRAQQAYYLENGNEFAMMADFDKLGLGVATGTSNYKYEVVGGGPSVTTVLHQGIPAKKDAAGAVTADPNSPLKAYQGGVSISKQSATSTESSTLAILCEGEKSVVNGGPSGTEAAGAGITFNANGAPECLAPTYKSIK